MCYTCFHFSIVYFVFFIKINVYGCEDLHLCLQFYFIEHLVWFLCQYYTILLQLLCSTACNKDGDTSVSFIVQDCFNHTIFSLYEIEYYSFKVRKEFCWNVDEDCSDSVDCVL